MLVIRMQRTGRKGHAQFRIVVQDSRRTPTSGKVVAQIGAYNPHTKAVTIDKEKASFYVLHGAQPTERVARLLKTEGVKLPSWVAVADNKERTTKNPEKLRKNQPEAPADAQALTDKPAEEPVAVVEEVAEEAAPAETAEAQPEETAETTAEPEEAPAEEPVEEKA